MKAAGTKQFAASREQVYAAAIDPERLARAAPGVQAVEKLDETHWLVRIKIPLGLTSLKMELRLELLEDRPPEHAHLHGSGRGLGGSIVLDTSFDLADHDDGTQMRYEIEVRLGGAVGSLGGRVLQPVFQLHVDHVLRSLDRELAASE